MTIRLRRDPRTRARVLFSALALAGGLACPVSATVTIGPGGGLTIWSAPPSPQAQRDAFIAQLNDERIQQVIRQLKSGSSLYQGPAIIHLQWIFEHYHQDVYDREQFRDKADKLLRSAFPALAPGLHSSNAAVRDNAIDTFTHFMRQGGLIARSYGLSRDEVARKMVDLMDKESFDGLLEVLRNAISVKSTPLLALTAALGLRGVTDKASDSMIDSLGKMLPRDPLDRREREATRLIPLEFASHQDFYEPAHTLPTLLVAIGGAKDPVMLGRSIHAIRLIVLDQNRRLQKHISKTAADDVVKSVQALSDRSDDRDPIKHAANLLLKWIREAQASPEPEANLTDHSYRIFSEDSRLVG